MNLNNAEFIKSAASQDGFIRDGRPQIVFAGRSNVGKSSVINRLLNRKNFARVGSAPGKTIHINYFDIDSKLYFVDLPGYGFAQVPKAEKERWGKLIEGYFASNLLTLGVLVVDARHKPTADDVTMADWFVRTGAPFIICVNKTDKCKKSELAANIALVSDTLNAPDAALIPFSAETGVGKDALLGRILSV